MAHPLPEKNTEKLLQWSSKTAVMRKDSAFTMNVHTLKGHYRL